MDSLLLALAGLVVLLILISPYGMLEILVDLMYGRRY